MRFRDGKVCIHRLIAPACVDDVRGRGVFRRRSAAQDMTIQARPPTPAANSERFDNGGIEEVIVEVAKAIGITEAHLAWMHGGA